MRTCLQAGWPDNGFAEITCPLIERKGRFALKANQPFFFCRFGRRRLDILERVFQSQLIRQIKKEMPDAIVLKTDPNYIQGFPDLLVLRGKRWAALEVKREEHAPRRPNQEHYISRLNRMSFARFIYPENKEDILHDLRKALGTRRTTRVPEPE